MRSSEHFNGDANYLVASHQFRRMMGATIAAAVCGVIGGAAGLLSLTTGHESDFPGAPVASISEPGAPVPSVSEYAHELAFDFAALQSAEIVGSPTAVVGAAEAPAVVNAGVAPSSAEADLTARCAQGTWPFFDDKCLWGTTAQIGHRKRIVFRLKSPWCSSLHYPEGAYYCRSRT
jgi:hypothetical protein